MLLKEDKRVDPRVIRTRRDLVASMCTLMRKKSFSQITVQEITEQAIINRATFYAHFEDKFELLKFMVQGSFQEKLKGKIGESGGLTPHHLRLLTLTTCEFLGEFDDQYSPIQGDGHPPIEQQIQPHIYTLLLGWSEDSGVDTSLQSAEVTAMMTSWVIFGTALQWSRGKRTLSVEMITDQVMSMLMSGIFG